MAVLCLPEPLNSYSSPPLQTLMCKSASTCAFAVTGSSLTNFWVQLALVSTGLSVAARANSMQ